MRGIHFTAILGFLLVLAAYWIGLKTDQNRVLAAIAKRNPTLQAPLVEAPLE